MVLENIFVMYVCCLGHTYKMGAFRMVCKEEDHIFSRIVVLKMKIYLFVIKCRYFIFSKSWRGWCWGSSFSGNVIWNWTSLVLENSHHGSIKFRCLISHMFFCVILFPCVRRTGFLNIFWNMFQGKELIMLFYSGFY